MTDYGTTHTCARSCRILASTTEQNRAATFCPHGFSLAPAGAAPSAALVAPSGIPFIATSSSSSASIPVGGRAAHAPFPPFHEGVASRDRDGSALHLTRPAEVPIPIVAIPFSQAIFML